MMSEKEFKITYATMSADNEELHAAFDAAIEKVKKERAGKTYPQIIGGARRMGDSFPVFNPADTREPLVHFQKGTHKDVEEAIAAARAAFPVWRDTPYLERLAILRRAADKISERRFEMSAIMVMEMGKSRLEALGEVEESADLIRYYCHQMEANDGYVHGMMSLSPNEHNTDVLKPYGVWAVISPFNFPLALSTGPVAAALVAGNTVVLKPSSDAPWSGYELVESLVEAGTPPGVVNFVTGGGGTVGMALVESEEVEGITFTGSFDIGFHQVYKRFPAHYPKPVIVEMGGKNPAIITKKADLDKAASGVVRSAFGMGGQKCSACSRAYVQRDVYDAFLGRLVAEAKAVVKIGDPLDRDTYLGPLVHESAHNDYKRFMEMARKDGKVVYGGNVLAEGRFAHGYFVEPAIVEGLSQDHFLVQTELFVPIVAVLPFDTLEEALEKANDVTYGLTAGFFSEERAEIDYFLDNIQAGVVYINRKAGATTGAWPGCQPFGGWKGSGSSGRNIGGLYSLLNYLREQSQTIWE
jgi:1-pyrroline-5-carboxylate dehydrogenase